MPRDPRKDPRAGDQLAVCGTVYRVLEVDQGRVRITASPVSAPGADAWCSLDRFKDRFRDAVESAPTPDQKLIAKSGPESGLDPILRKYYLETEGSD